MENGSPLKFETRGEEKGARVRGKEGAKRGRRRGEVGKWRVVMRKLSTGPDTTPALKQKSRLVKFLH